MFLIKINGKDYRLPQSISDIKVSQYVDFTKALSQIKPVNDIYQNTISLANCLAEYWRITMEEFADVEVDDETTEAFLLGTRDIRQHNDIAGIVAMINNVVTTYDYDAKVFIDYPTFTYKDVVWNIPNHKLNEVTNLLKIQNPPVLGSYLRINEAKRVAAEVMGVDEKGNDKDPNGSAQYSELLFIVASLASNAEMDKLMDLNDKIKYFEDIDMKTALDLYFFLTSSMAN